MPFFALKKWEFPDFKLHLKNGNSQTSNYIRKYWKSKYEPKKEKEKEKKTEFPVNSKEDK